MDIERERKRLSHEELLSHIKNIDKSSWFIAYQNLPFNGGLYSVLVHNKYIDKTRESSSWDLSIGGGLPCCEKSYSNNNEPQIFYYQYGSKYYQPLVIYRDFQGLKPNYIEISEEFRLFHNLFYDKTTNKYIKIDDNGDEEDIVIIKEDNNVMIKLKAIKQFLAIKDMTLLSLFDIIVYSRFDLQQLQLEVANINMKEDTCVYSYDIGNIDFSFENYKTIARLCGKVYIKGYNKENCGVWPYNETEIEAFDDFIIGIDENGKEKTFTSDPDKLSNYFGKNPSAPNYLTPVFFKKEVLNKYYAEPNKYEVSDGYVSCGYLWRLRLDNNKKDSVMVFLGDLGRDLSHKERLYWKSFNIPPNGRGMSEACWKRSFEAQPCNPQSLDLLFKYLYDNFREDWYKKYGWNLFLPLVKDDNYHYLTLHIPSNNQSEFDKQIQSLTKILIESINESKLNEYVGDDVKKSINKLEVYLKIKNLDDYEKHITFLKNLQNLRSSSVAHRKGDNFIKIAKVFGLNEKPFDTIFEDILDSSCEFIRYLTKVFIDENIIE